MPKAEETRATIIEKTSALFNTKGFVGTTLTDMEKATGLTKGSIYNNFTNKDELALAVFDHNLKMVNTVVKREMSKHDKAKGQLLAYLKVYTSNESKYPFPVGGCPILNTAIEADDTHPRLRKKASAAILAWKNKIISTIQLGIKNKEFAASVNAEEVALTMVATIEGGIMISKVTGKSIYLKSIMNSIEKMINTL
jgi:TetR/AcrR family transcriptional repressor of nem operon